MSNNVGQAIKHRRKELDISAEQLADKIGVSAATIYRYEKGDIEKLPVAVLESIAKSRHAGNLNIFVHKVSNTI